MAFMAGVLGSEAGQAQAKNAAYQQQLKAAADAKAAAQTQAQFDAQQKLAQQQVDQSGAAQAAAAKHQAHQDKLDDIANGVGLAPFAPPLNHGVPLTFSQKADIAREEAHYYRSHGASVKADEADKEATDLDKRAQAAATAAEKTQEDANHLVEIMGRVANWSAEQQIALKRIAMQETIQVQRGQVAENVARDRIAGAAQQLADRLAASLKIAGMNNAQRAAAAQQLNSVRTAIAQMQQGSANWRALVGQGLEQFDASGNPIMPGGGGATINVYGGNVTPPNVNNVKPPGVDALAGVAKKFSTPSGVTVGNVNGQWIDSNGTVYDPRTWQPSK